MHEQLLDFLFTAQGVWRQREPNIGVPPHGIQPKMKNRQDDLVFWFVPIVYSPALIFRWRKTRRRGGPFIFRPVALPDHAATAVDCIMNTTDRQLRMNKR